MTPADLALDNAIHFEGVKHAYRQTKDGVVISFVVHPHDVPKGLADAPLGSRYIVALVQVDDDEQPVHQSAKETLKAPAEPQPATDKPPGGAKRTVSGEASSRSRMDWRELQPAAQAGIRSSEPSFWAFLREVMIYPDVRDADTAATAVRHICKVNSRSELSSDHRKRVLWHQLDATFQAWQAKEGVGA
jgi:hypothetical protein